MLYCARGMWRGAGNLSLIRHHPPKQHSCRRRAPRPVASSVQVLEPVPADSIYASQGSAWILRQVLGLTTSVLTCWDQDLQRGLRHCWVGSI